MSGYSASAALLGHDWPKGQRLSQHPDALLPRKRWAAVSMLRAASPTSHRYAGVVVGTVHEAAQPQDLPMQRLVRCFDEATGRLLAQTVSSAEDGRYRFSGLDHTRRVFVVAFDDQDHYKAVVADKLLPTLEPQP